MFEGRQLFNLLFLALLQFAVLCWRAWRLEVSVTALREDVSGGNTSTLVLVLVLSGKFTFCYCCVDVNAVINVVLAMQYISF
jgi:hypothetical protein